MAENTQSFSDIIQSYTQVHGLSQQYEDFRKQAKAGGSLDEMIGEETGESPGFAPDKNSDRYKQAEAAEQLEQYYRKRTADYIRTKLTDIANSAPYDALLLAASQVKHDSDKGLGKVLSDYSLYSRFLAGPQKNQNGEVNERGYAEVIEKVKKKLPEIIAKRIEAKTGDKEAAKYWANFLSAFAGERQEYLTKTIDREAKSIKEDIQKKGIDSLVSYLKESLKSDDDYLGIGLYLHQAAQQKEAEKSKNEDKGKKKK